MQTLKRGSRGSAVKTLQTLLGVTADGIFGAKTEAAVKAFQTAEGLTADGIVGPLTWAALGVVEEDTAIACEDLKQYASPHGTMVYGPDKTYSTYANGGCGVTSFAVVQRAYGLAPEGETATETIQRLGTYSYQHGYRPKGAGTNAGLFKTNGTTYATATKRALIEDAIRAGKLVILCIKKGFGNGYTGSGHYVVAYGIKGDYMLLRDVGSGKTSRQQVKLSSLPTGIKMGYIMSVKG